MPIIDIKNFDKSFGNVKVIDDLSFDVKEGELFAFIGANGSGKTTTIRSLLGIYEADGGELLVSGKKYTREDSSILGYLPEERGLYLNSPVLETMVYFGQIKGMSSEEAKKASLEYLEKVGLSGKEKESIKKLSSGQQQKIQLGITIINKPKLLILDEPSKGLDPVNRELLMEILKELHNDGATILFSTHQMDEAEKIAQRILMIKNGRKALLGKLSDVKESFGENVIKLEYEGDLDDENNLFTASTIESNYAELTMHEGVTSDQVLKYLIDNDVKVYKFERSTPSLDQIFIKVTESENYG